MINYTNITKYHEQGYKGQGINFLNLEDMISNDGHGQHVCNTFSEIAPRAKVFNGTLGCRIKSGVVSNVKLNINNNAMVDLIEFIKTNNIKIINASLSIEDTNEPLNIWLRENIIDKLGVIITNSAGNHFAHVCGIYKYCAIVVGAGGVKNGKFERHYYSGQGEEVDFITFIPNSYLSGTSFSSPCLAGQIALLLNKYGDLNQYQVYNILKQCCEDLGQAGKDNSYGWGLPRLPLEEVKVMFKDTNGHWAEKEIDKAVNSGILNGYPDGTFKPDNTITRAEMAVIINRILEKVGK